MVEGLADAPAPAPRGSSSSRSPASFALLALAFVGGATLATLALAAALFFLGLWPALALGLLVAVGLPLFLVLRLGRTLKRRRLPALVQNIASLLLALATHAALFGVCLDWVGRSAGDVFLVANTLVERTVGEVPLLSGILKRGAEEATLTREGAPRPAGDGGPAATDGGPSPSDGGLAGEAAPGGDGGVTPTSPSPLTARSDVNRAVSGLVSLVRTDRGGYAAVVITLDAGGATAKRTLDLTRFASEGGPVAADASKDGGAAFVTGGGSVVYAGPGESPRALPALSRGAKLPLAAGSRDTRSLRAVRDVAIAPGGALLAVADIVVKSFNDAAAPVQLHSALLGYDPGKPAPVVVLRVSGQAVPDAAEGSVSSGFALRRAGPAGRVALVESFLEGGSGANSDERLFAGRVDEGNLLQEVARTGDAVDGLPQRALARFGEASVLADGRVLFGAGFLEEGAGATLLSGRAGQPPRALAAEAVRDGKTPWPLTAPAAPELFAEPDGRFAFVKPGAGIVLAELDRPLEATLLAPGVRVYQGSGGQVASLGEANELFRPTLSQGGDWLLVGAKLSDGRRALLLLSRGDTSKRVAEALLVEGQALPGAATAAKGAGGAKAGGGKAGGAKAGGAKAQGGKRSPGAAGSIRSLMLFDWRGGAPNGTSPAGPP